MGVFDQFKGLGQNQSWPIPRYYFGTQFGRTEEHCEKLHRLHPVLHIIFNYLHYNCRHNKVGISSMKITDVRFEVSTAVNMMIIIFWEMTP
jgi:hypothetical protein